MTHDDIRRQNIWYTSVTSPKISNGTPKLVEVSCEFLVLNSSADWDNGSTRSGSIVGSAITTLGSSHLAGRMVNGVIFSGNVV